MNLDAFQLFSNTNHWLAIAPEIALMLLAVALLLIDLFVAGAHRKIVPNLAILGQIAILAFVLLTFEAYDSEPGALFSGMIVHSTLGEVMRVFFLLCSILVTYLGTVYLAKQTLPKMEFFHITMVVTAALMLLSQSSHFVMLFVALETVTIGFYILVSYCRTSPFSLESGLKYLILGGASSSILLFGIVLLYGAAGNPNLVGFTTDGMSFTALGDFIVQNQDSRLVQMGIVLVISGICFKIGAVPFQIWVPDVYQGAPTPVTAFLAVASKAAGFVVLVNLIKGPFASMAGLTVPLLSAIAVVTILFGNLSALSQRNVKRLMGLSGVAHAGYILLGAIALAEGVVEADWAIVFYLFTYLVGSFAVFGVMAHMAGGNDETQELEDYQDLGRNHPFLAGVLTIGLGSLAGIPPLAGFIGKVFLFVAAFKAHAYPLLAVALFGVVVSIYYYFGWVRESFFNGHRFPAEEELEQQVAEVHSRERRLKINGLHRITLGALAAFAIILGIYQGFLGSISL